MPAPTIPIMPAKAGISLFPPPMDSSFRWNDEGMESMPNILYYGDNLNVLRHKIRDEAVDLCYIDPPFNSKRNYFQIYNNIDQDDVAQAQAFTDTWTWNLWTMERFVFASRDNLPLPEVAREFSMIVPSTKATMLGVDFPW